MSPDPNVYGPLVADLLASDRLPELGPGKPNLAVRSQLAALTVENLFPAGAQDRDMARACLAALWLYHDFLEQSHQISQEIDTPTGSYWHGIMHRREPDYGNAKYWFRRVGRHPIFEKLANEVQLLAANGHGVVAGLAQETWDPFAFVDWCEQAIGNGTAEEHACREVQSLEWTLLFQWCWHQAMANDADTPLI